MSFFSRAKSSPRSGTAANALPPAEPEAIASHHLISPSNPCETTHVSNGAPILVSEFKDLIWIRVEGKGDFQNSPGLKDYSLAMIQRGHRAIVIDLQNCSSMDSTFMGTLTGIAIRLKAIHGTTLEVINANPRNQQLLQSLGLDQILMLDLDGSTRSQERDLVTDNVARPAPAAELDKEERAKFILDAHEELCKANKENVGRFKDVIEYLKHDLEQKNS